ncbi:PAS domain-containing protein [Halorubrum sp. N11]|uniref:PAS domain-containing protein n=1 Tax=Halorubrum sp. N11 TaxID=3402276 RepID=UPI003EBEC0D3
MDENSHSNKTADAFGVAGEGVDTVYESIFHEVDDAVFLIAVARTEDGYEFTYQENNTAHQELTGLSVDTIRGQTPRELLGEEQGSAVAANYRRCLEQGETIEYEERITFPRATSHWHTKLTPITEDGTITRIVGVARDVTAQKEQEREYQRTYREFQTVLETMSAAVFLKDADGRYLLMNQACRDLLDVDEDPAGMTDEDLFPREVAEQARSDDRRVLENGAQIELEETIPTVTGESVRLTRKSPVYDDDGEIVAVCGVSTDITEQKERERALQQLKDRLELAVEGAQLGVWDWDMTTDEVEFNEQWAQMLGHSLDEIEPHLDAWERRVHPDDLGAVEASLSGHIAGETTYYDTEHRMRTARGEWKWIRDIGKIVERDDDGEPVRAVGIHLDIDDQKRREEELEETKQRLTVALEGTNTGVWEWDLATDEVVWTESIERLFGVEPGSFEGTYDAFIEYVHPDDLPELERALEETIATGRPLRSEYRIQTPDDRQLWGESRAELVEDDDGSRRMVGIISEVTSRKEYELALEATRKELRKIIDLVPDLVFVKNRDGEYLLANEATADAYGKTPEEVEGKSEGEIIPEADDSAAFRQDDLAVIESGEPKTIGEETLTTAAGETRVFQTTKIPYEVPETGEDAVLGYARDVTELKEYERTLEGQRDSLTLLNQVVRHDIRNQLMVVESYTELLEDSLSDDQSRTYARTVIEAAKQASEITKTAKDVTDVLLQVGIDRCPMDLRAELVEQIAQIRSDQDRATVSVDGEIPDVTVLADELLEAVFRNLLTNAVTHNDKDVAEIAVSARVSDDTVCVSIADNGPGIADEHKKQIFKEGEKGLESGGTGVGLYLVKTLVDRYEGEIRVEDNEPTGSVFAVELPIAD